MQGRCGPGKVAACVVRLSGKQKAPLVKVGWTRGRRQRAEYGAAGIMGLQKAGSKSMALGRASYCFRRARPVVVARRVDSATQDASA